jgi:ketosteroid isomerase-like protein
MDTSTSTAKRNVSQASTASNEAQIRAVIEDWAEAHRVKDAARVTSHYTPDNVQFGMAPPLLQAGPTARDTKAFAAWFAGFSGPIDYDIRDLTIVAGEDTAFCYFLNRLGATAVQYQARFQVWNRGTLGLRKVDGRWLIAHAHASVPFYMDGSFRAAVDLQP